MRKPYCILLSLKPINNLTIKLHVSVKSVVENLFE